MWGTKAEAGRALAEFIGALAGLSVATWASTLAEPSTVRLALNTGTDRFTMGGVRHFAITTSHNRYRQ
jgi:hypothetical protein